MTIELPQLKSLEHFLFEVPLYAPHRLSKSFGPKQLYGWRKDDEPQIRIDGHCPFCNRQSTFALKFAWIPGGVSRIEVSSRMARDEMSAICSRDDSHRLHYIFLFEEMVVQKIGQYPSLADIANDEVSLYRKDMDKLDAQEFHKAIGLAAHGVGVGSFVYLRRVFERLIDKHFQEFKGVEGWEDSQFYSLRMEDKISLLKDHLPEFLVTNRKIYSILSIGVHALDDKTCLGWFEVMKQSILIILEDDRKKKEELERRELFTGAIAGFSPKKLGQ